jgi:hypothetical protein
MPVQLAREPGRRRAEELHAPTWLLHVGLTLSLHDMCSPVEHPRTFQFQKTPPPQPGPTFPNPTPFCGYDFHVRIPTRYTLKTRPGCQKGAMAL